MQISLKAARINARLTLKEAAKALSVSESCLINWEKETSYPNVKDIKKIESVYNIKFCDLFFLTLYTV